MLVKVYSVGICHSQLAWKYSKRSKVWHLKAFFSWNCSYKIRKNISPLVNSATSNLKKLRQYSALISSLWRQLKSLSRKNILQWESLEQNLPIYHHLVEAGCVAGGGVFCHIHIRYFWTKFNYLAACVTVLQQNVGEEFSAIVTWGCAVDELYSSSPSP